MYKINQEQFNTLPDDLKALYVKLPNPSSEEVRECFPETKSTTRQPSGGMILNPDAGWNNNSMVDKTERGHNDSGNASRFFKSIIYQAKSSKRERNAGCEDLYILKDNIPTEDIDEIKHLLSI